MVCRRMVMRRSRRCPDVMTIPVIEKSLIAPFLAIAALVIVAACTKSRNLAALEQLFLPGFQLGGGGYYTLRGKGPWLNKGLYRLAFADCTNVTWAKGMLEDIEWRSIRDDVAKRVWEFI